MPIEITFFQEIHQSDQHSCILLWCVICNVLRFLLYYAMQIAKGDCMLGVPIFKQKTICYFC